MMADGCDRTARPDGRSPLADNAANPLYEHVREVRKRWRDAARGEVSQAERRLTAIRTS